MCCRAARLPWCACFIRPLPRPPLLPTGYGTIIGLSGSLGSPEEKDFLRSTFDAEFVVVPPFLDTCTNISKQVPSLVDGGVHVFGTRDTQLNKVVELAIEKRSVVPVLIITTSETHARAVHEKVTARLKHLPAEAAPQLFVTTDAANASMLVEAATKAVDLPGGSKEWRITVTDYIGGRGHDYHTVDEDVDDAGGLLVIATQIPDSEREWVQWLGRTARSDRRGQYAVVLSTTDEPLASHRSLLAESECKPHPGSPVCQPALIAKLLVERDKEVKRKLERNNVKRGQLLNELCDKFYAKYHIQTPYYWGEKEKKLSAFLSKQQNKLEDAIANFAVEVGLATTAAAYAAASQYMGSPPRVCNT